MTSQRLFVCILYLVLQLPQPHFLPETRLHVPALAGAVHISYAPLSHLLSSARLQVLLLPLMTISHALQKRFLTMTTLEIPDSLNHSCRRHSHLHRRHRHCR